MSVLAKFSTNVEIFFKYKRTIITLCVATTFFLSLINCIVNLKRNPSDREIKSDAKIFHQWSNTLLENNFSPRVMIGNDYIQYRKGGQLLYSTFIYLNAFIKSLTDKEVGFKHLLVKYNSIVFSISLAIVFYLTLKLTQSLSFASILFAFHLFMPNYMWWTGWIFSDINMLFFCVLVIFLDYFNIIKSKRSFSFLLLYLLVITLLLFTKPNVILTLPILLLSFLGLFNHYDLIYKHRNKIFAFIIISSLCFLFTYTYLIYQESDSGWLAMSFEYYKRGRVVDSAPETYLPNPKSYLDFLKITFSRLYYYFHWWPPNISDGKILRSTYYYLPLYILALLGLIRFVKGQLSKKQTAFFLYLSLWSIALSYITCITIIDYNYRYRIPFIPILIILASLGSITLASYFSEKTKSYSLSLYRAFPPLTFSIVTLYIFSTQLKDVYSIWKN